MTGIAVVTVHVLYVLYITECFHKMNVHVENEGCDVRELCLQTFGVTLVSDPGAERMSPLKEESGRKSQTTGVP